MYASTLPYASEEPGDTYALLCSQISLVVVHLRRSEVVFSCLR